MKLPNSKEVYVFACLNRQIYLLAYPLWSEISLMIFPTIKPILMILFKFNKKAV